VAANGQLAALLNSNHPFACEAGPSPTRSKEDGTGKADANSHADVTDGDAFFAGHLYATA
jgi:hypothetical protein